MLILILLLHSGTKNSVDCVDASVVDIKCSNLADVIVGKFFMVHKIVSLLSASNAL